VVTDAVYSWCIACAVSFVHPQQHHSAWPATDKKERRGCKLRSGVIWQGALKQKGIK